MTNRYTEILARQIAEHLTQQANQLTSSLNPSEQVEAITPAQILAVLEGNANWLNAFEQELDNMFQRSANRAASYWQQEIIPQLTPTLPSTPANGALNNSFNRLIRNGASSLFDSLFERERTTQRESDRSSEASSRYRNSRGQTQAELARELNRGQRYQ
jgi:hypothetical protein